MKINEILQQYNEGLITFDEFYYKISEIETKIHIPLFEIQKDFVIHIKQASETKQIDDIIKAKMIYEKQLFDLWHQLAE